MCTFCTLEDLESCTEIEAIEIGFGRIPDFLRVSLWYVKTNNGPVISVGVWGPEGGDVIDELNVPIKYCPICGRELDKHDPKIDDESK